jgi:hypothetical protein
VRVCISSALFIYNIHRSLHGYTTAKSDARLACPAEYGTERE